MSELRQNIATKEWIVIAKERAQRPHDFKDKPTYREDYEHSDDCPFCPGNERMLTDPVYLCEHNGKWLIKGITNKFPAFEPSGSTKRTLQGIYREMKAVGHHEVIVESPVHNDHFNKMSIRHIERVIRSYVDRYCSAMGDERVEVVIIFKNYGANAGCSLQHPHSQLIAAPVVPTPMRYMLQAAKSYYDDNGECAFCVMMEEELREKERIVMENDSFVVFCPFASGCPFETWIVPRVHQPNFGEITEKEIKDLALIYKCLFTRIYNGLNDPDFNFIIKTPPRDESNDRSHHWYVQVLPKLTKRAGFELGSGMLINVTLPEECARFLREEGR